MNRTRKIAFSDVPLPLKVAMHGKDISTVLSTKPSPLDCGGVRADGGQREQPLTITNLSSEPVELTAPERTYNTIQPVVLYEVESLQGCTIEPGKSLIVRVGYNPPEETLHETTLFSGATKLPKPRSVALTVDLGSLDFGQADMSKSVEPQVVTASNKAAQQQRVVVKLKDPVGSSFAVGFDPDKAGLLENEVQAWLQEDTAPKVLIPVSGNDRALIGEGGGWSTASLQVWSTGLLALVALGSRRRRRE